jgi:hypothetical protein
MLPNMVPNSVRPASSVGGAMEVKGTAFLARKAFVEGEHGRACFDQVLREVSLSEPIFSSPILATTRIPIEAFLRLNDAIVHRLYGGDTASYFVFGEASAAWALSDGPYKRFVTNRSTTEFVGSAPLIYRSYFSVGEAKGELVGPQVRLFIRGIPARHAHVYFEYAINGYFRKGLEMVSGQEVTMRAEKGFSKGDAEVLYEYELQ